MVGIIRGHGKNRHSCGEQMIPHCLRRWMCVIASVMDSGMSVEEFEHMETTYRQNILSGDRIPEIGMVENRRPPGLYRFVYMELNDLRFVFVTILPGCKLIDIHCSGMNRLAPRDFFTRDQDEIVSSVCR
jgi:hypothetical protein